MVERDEVVRHGTATGGQVSISLPGFELGRPATSHAIALVDDDRQEFVTGTGDFARWAAEEVAGLELDLTYKFAGGRLLAGSAPAQGAPDQQHTAVVWIGGRWSLYAFHPNAAPATVIDLLAMLELEEGRHGLTLHPAQDGLGWEAPAQLTKVVPGLGLLDVAPMHPHVRSQIPRWAGTPARGGEVYVDRSNPHQTVYTIANRSSATRLLPDQATTRPSLQRGLGRLKVACTEGTPASDRANGRPGR